MRLRRGYVIGRLVQFVVILWGAATLNFFILFQFPVLPPSAYSASDLAFIVTRVLELTYTSHSMAPFARPVVPPLTW